MGNDCEKLTHIHEVVFAGLRWVWVPLSPSRLANSAGFGAFGKMECLFSIAPDANSWWLAHWSKDEEVRVDKDQLGAEMEARRCHCE